MTGEVCVTGVREQSDDSFADIAAMYAVERDDRSYNALLLDPWFCALAASAQRGRVLDLGCGTGATAEIFACRGHHVTGVDSSPAMLAQCRARFARRGLDVVVLDGDINTFTTSDRFNIVLLNLVLDHVAAPAALLRNAASWLAPRGQVTVVVPHPFKDSGAWVTTNTGADYSGIFVANYFEEGPIVKARFGDDGSVAIPEVRSFKRNVGTYFALLREAGLVVDRLLEPAPDPASARPNSANYAKSSRVPYFLIFDCRKEVSHASAE